MAKKNKWVYNSPEEAARIVKKRLAREDSARTANLKAKKIQIAKNLAALEKKREEAAKRVKNRLAKEDSTRTARINAEKMRIKKNLAARKKKPSSQPSRASIAKRK